MKNLFHETSKKSLIKHQMQSIRQRNLIFKIGDGVSLPVHKQTLFFGSLLIVGLIVSVLCGMRFGSVEASWYDVWLVLTGKTNANDVAETIYQLRVPRVLGSLISGMLMALSGYMLQIVARNALADPGVLGLSNGAALMTIIVFIWIPTLSVFWASLVTFIGATATGLSILLLAHRYIHTPFIVLVGIAMSTMLAAVTDIILSSVRIELMVAVQSFLSGSFDALNHYNAFFLFVWFLLCLFVFMVIGRSINPMSLGHQTAMRLGVSSQRLSLAMTFLSIVAMSPVIALAGVMSFIGLISTFLAKNIIGYRGSELGFVSMLIGATMTLWADTLGRTLFAPVMVQAGVFIAVIGAFFFVLMTRYISK